MISIGINPYDQANLSHLLQVEFSTNRLGIIEQLKPSLPLLSVVAGPRTCRGAFAAGLSFILINRITGAVFQVTSATLADKAATVPHNANWMIKVPDYFIILEAPALNMGYL